MSTIPSMTTFLRIEDRQGRSWYAYGSLRGPTLYLPVGRLPEPGDRVHAPSRPTFMVESVSMVSGAYARVALGPIIAPAAD